MELLTKRVFYSDFKVKDLSKEDVCFFDIETTGLNRNNDIIYLIGVLYFNKDVSSWELKQFFAPQLRDELILIESAVEFINSFKTIINYNGDSFDIPFLNHRLALFNSGLKISEEKSLDIYKIVRKNKMYLEVDNLKLKTVEKYLGIFREDLYTGKDCIEFYRNYILTGDNTLKDKVLKHNYDDLYYLLPLLDILDILELNKKIDLSYDNSNLELLIDNIRILNDFLIITGRVEGNLPNNIYYYGSNYKIVMVENKLVELSFQINKGLVSPTEESFYIVTEEFGLKGPIGKNYGYEISESISLITIDKKFLVENIKDFVRKFIESKLLLNR